jgi:thiamine-phosphate pyrophosphorylase
MVPGVPRIETILAAARAGVDLIQIREPGLDDRSLLEVVRAAVAATDRTAARIVVNDRLDVALASGAAGVHLRGTSFPASRARRVASPGSLIGRSVHSVTEAQAAERDGGCDYLVFGTVFASRSKPPGQSVAGVDALRVVCASVALPVLGIGGITPAVAPAVAAAGAAGVAAIGAFSDARDLPALVRSLRQSFDT